jgi:hypothetical protein
MAISMSCACGRALRLKDELAGRKIRCPQCSIVLQVPDGDVADDFEAAPDPPSPATAAIRTSSSYQPAPAPPPRPPEPPKRRKRRRSSSGRGFGISFSPGIIAGLLMMIGAVVWFVVGLYAGWLFFYPPILFILGLIRFVMSLMGHEED